MRASVSEDVENFVNNCSNCFNIVRLLWPLWLSSVTFFVHIMFSPHMKLLDTSITVFYYFVLDYLFAHNDKSVDICIFIIVCFLHASDETQ